MPRFSPPPADKEVCLAIGCADAEDVFALRRDIGKVVAIEPCREWWTDRRHGIPFDYRAPSLRGDIDLPNASVDLCVALGALHHVATVQHMVSEMARILRPGGWMLVREPMISMGDFRQDRPGLTRNERGIAMPMMKRFIADAGLTLTRAEPCYFTPLGTAAARLGIRPYNSATLVRLDAMLSKAFSFNAKYWRPGTLDKFAPSTAAYVAQKR